MTGAVIGLLFGLFLLFLMGQALWGPLRFLLKIAFRFLLGGLALLLFNLCSAFWGWSFGINALSAFTVGVLGLPGLVLLALLRYFYG